MGATASRSTSAVSCSAHPGEHRAGLPRWSRGGAIAFALAILTAAAGPDARAAGPSVVGSPHDLTLGTATSPGSATREICVFCHVPHGASGDGPLWHADVPHHAYKVYSSATLDADPRQPDGASKLCLSCHDGTLASTALAPRPGLGTVRRGVGPHGVLPGGAGGPVLGTDLSDDHPVSFVYDADLAARDGQLLTPERAPSGLGGTVASDLLDPHKKLQCTSCHDAHDDSRGGFLRIDGGDDTLCTTCHALRDYPRSAHFPGQSPLLHAGCATCHTPHGASRESALLREPERELCGRCHEVQGRAMAPGAATRHTLGERRDGATGRVMACSTCHAPHVVRPARLYERQLLTDPDDPMRPPALLPDAETPYSYTASPRGARDADPGFCLDCHDGSWPGAINIRGELASPRVVLTSFAVGRTNLHAVHADASRADRTSIGRRSIGPTSLGGTAIGCTYCHDAHGTRGNAGVPRGKLLYPWLDVRAFPYRGKASCGTNDAGRSCHAP